MPTPIYTYAQPADLGAVGISPAALASMPVSAQVAAIASASELIDGYLRSVFTLPLVQVGKDVTRATAIIAAYDLLTARGYNPDAGADSQYRLRYEDIIGWLKDIAAGKAMPSVTDSGLGAVEGAASSGRAKVTSASSRGYSSRGDGDFSGGGSFSGRGWYG